MRQTLPLYPAALCFGLMLSISQARSPMARWSRALRLNDTSTFPIPRTSRRWYWICIHTVFFQTAMFGQPFECRKHCATASTAWQLPSIWSSSRICRTSLIRIATGPMKKP